MTFRRSSFGLSNLRLFIGVDLVVFTEGGQRTISKENAYAGEYETSLDDFCFWQPLFSFVHPNLTTSFRALGSKSTLKEIGKEIELRNVHGVCVVMDRDYDYYFYDQIKHPNVIYTRCYSWENELFHAESIENVFFRITGADRRKVQVRQDIQKMMTKMTHDLRWLTKADVLLCVSGSFLFDRSRVASVIASTRSRPPQIRRDWLIEEVRKKRSGIGKMYLIKRGLKFNTKKDCFGKIFSTFAYRIIFHLIKKYTKLPSIAKAYAFNLLVEEVCRWLSTHQKSPVGRYYLGRLSQVIV